MYSKDCPRCLDNPLVFFGLELEELALVLVVSCAFLVILSPILAVATGLALFFGLRKFKQGQPQGYLFELAYRLGIVWILSGVLKIQHVIPFRPWKNRAIRLSPVSDVSDASERALLDRYWINPRVVNRRAEGAAS